MARLARGYKSGTGKSMYSKDKSNYAANKFVHSSTYDESDISIESQDTPLEGKIVDEKTEEKVFCDDGVKDFLHGMGIADNCQFFTWMMPLGQTMVEQRSIACKRLDGGYEIVQGYHYIK